MGGGQMETPVRGQAQPGQDGRLAIAAGTCKVAQNTGWAKRVGFYSIARARPCREGRCSMTWHRLAAFAATLDPATLAAIGLAGTHMWGSMT